MARSGVRIREVEPGSLGTDLGLAPGDEILAINGNPIQDELALKFHLAEETLRMEVRKAGGEEQLLETEIGEGEDLGVTVEDFKTRTCNNACLFCFIDQLPPNVRPTLKVKDDDYRLSFLHGNYITLTNLPERELDRIITQALSPLYVSVHATDPDLRMRMLGRRKPDDLDRKIRRLTEGSIRLHTQIVLMPGINDGIHLEESVRSLSGYHPGVESVAIVPLGLSDHGPTRERHRAVTAEFCREVIGQARPWQQEFRRTLGSTFAYLADEFYIQGGVELPGTDHYDDFAQIEDGIGMVRKFLDDFAAELGRRRRLMPRLNGTLVTGKLFHPFLAECIGRLNGKLNAQLKVRQVANRFMGKDITVAGLLGGNDIADALAGTDVGDFVVIPQEAVSRVDAILVDNLTLEDVARRVGRPVYPSGRTVRDFFRLLSSL
jgi:putative radical SAM enzyme (TIGR03279 family)